jgi:hypothetical protein
MPAESYDRNRWRASSQQPQAGRRVGTKPSVHPPPSSSSSPPLLTPPLRPLLCPPSPPPSPLLPPSPPGLPPRRSRLRVLITAVVGRAVDQILPPPDPLCMCIGPSPRCLALSVARPPRLRNRSCRSRTSAQHEFAAAEHRHQGARDLFPQPGNPPPAWARRRSVRRGVRC